MTPRRNCPYLGHLLPRPQVHVETKVGSKAWADLGIVVRDAEELEPVCEQLHHRRNPTRPVLPPAIARGEEDVGLGLG
eukprot:749368-Rhodomonas_salina.1